MRKLLCFLICLILLFPIVAEASPVLTPNEQKQEEKMNPVEAFLANTIKQAIEKLIQDRVNDPKMQSKWKEFVKSLLAPAVFIGFGYLAEIGFGSARMQYHGRLMKFGGYLCAIASIVSCITLAFLAFPEVSWAAEEPKPSRGASSILKDSFAFGKPGFTLMFLMIMGIMGWAIENICIILRANFLGACAKTVTNLIALLSVATLAWQIVSMVIGWSQT